MLENPVNRSNIRYIGNRAGTRTHGNDSSPARSRAHAKAVQRYTKRSSHLAITCAQGLVKQESKEIKQTKKINVLIMGVNEMNRQTMRQRNSLKQFSNDLLIAEENLLTDVISKDKKERTDNLLGLIGMFFIQGATLPTLYYVLFSNGVIPPLTLVGGVFVGLLFYQARALRNIKREWVYVLGNCFGLVSNGIMTFLLLF
jgi:hypothetical protein